MEDKVIAGSFKISNEAKLILFELIQEKNEKKFETLGVEIEHIIDMNSENELRSLFEYLGPISKRIIQKFIDSENIINKPLKK